MKLSFARERWSSFLKVNGACILKNEIEKISLWKNLIEIEFSISKWHEFDLELAQIQSRVQYLMQYWVLIPIDFTHATYRSHARAFSSVLYQGSR